MTATRILVVDDEPDLRTLYELTLLRQGFLVETAEDLASALDCLERHRFDVVITDMRLPDGLLGCRMATKTWCALSAVQRTEHVRRSNTRAATICARGVRSQFATVATSL
jgi:two-component system response regulator PilR (NtrC family)